MGLIQKVWWMAVGAGMVLLLASCQNWKGNQSNAYTPQGLTGTNTNNPTEGEKGQSGNSQNIQSTPGNTSGVGTAGGM